VRERVLGRVVPAMQKRGAIKHWIVDDTTLLKSGRHGVAIQMDCVRAFYAKCYSSVFDKRCMIGRSKGIDPTYA
jgi:hypothetical protein